MTDGLFAGMDAPRPLPDDLRDRLEERLLAPAARPLDASLDARLASTLGDPVAAALHGLDDPRALSPRQRTALEGSLVRRRRLPWLAGAAAAVAVGVAAGSLVLGGSDHHRQQLAGARPSPRASAQALTGGSGVERPASPPTPARVAVPGALTGTADGLTYSSAAQLVVSPGTAPAGAVVHLRGTGLRTVVRVLFGGRSADGLVVHADGTVSVRVPGGPAPGSAVDVTAVLSDGRRLTAPQGFRYRAP